MLIYSIIVFVGLIVLFGQPLGIVPLSQDNSYLVGFGLVIPGTALIIVKYLRSPITVTTMKN